jgi:7-carboxy-7-deazaguanine synthase (Cx14CxxC type)
MAYNVKEIFLTLQGEGHWAGSRAVFCRFTGCNLWSGREEDRAAAACNFCDTDFVGTDGSGGGRFETAEALAQAVGQVWGAESAHRWVVLTGGEPLLQVDAPLLAQLHQRGFRVAVETNGTVTAPQGIDWLTVSPKGAAPLKVTRGQELKLVWPQSGIDPEGFVQLDFEGFRLQPLDDAHSRENTRLCVEYCLAHPRWQLGLQQHKILGLP